MNSVKPVYDFDVNQEGNDYIFTYVPAKRGFAVGCFIMTWSGAFALIPLLILPIKEAETALFVWIAITAGITVLAMYLGNLKRKVPNNFVISKDYYKTANNSYDRLHISNLQIKNTIDKKFSHETVIVGGGLAGGMAGAGNDIGRLYRKSKRKTAFFISFLYGSKEITLAKPLTENQAIAMFNKISQL